MSRLQKYLYADKHNTCIKIHGSVLEKASYLKCILIILLLHIVMIGLVACSGENAEKSSEADGKVIEVNGDFTFVLPKEFKENEELSDDKIFSYDSTAYDIKKLEEDPNYKALGIGFDIMYGEMSEESHYKWIEEDGRREIVEIDGKKAYRDNELYSYIFFCNGKEYTLTGYVTDKKKKKVIDSIVESIRFIKTEEEYAYSNDYISIAKIPGWTVEEANSKYLEGQGEDAFMYSSVNGVINVYFKQIDGITDKELQDYMKTLMPTEMENGIEELGNTNISVKPSSITVNDKVFPSCVATYEYDGNRIEEIVFARLTDQGVMMVDICAFGKMNTSQIIEQMILCK